MKRIIIRNANGVLLNVTAGSEKALSYISRSTKNSVEKIALKPFDSRGINGKFTFRKTVRSKLETIGKVVRDKVKTLETVE